MSSQATVIPAQTRLAWLSLVCVAFSGCNSPAPGPAPPPASATAHVNADLNAHGAASASASPPALPLPVAASVAPAPLPPATSAAPPSRHYVLAAIGDSLTDPRSHGGGYLEYLKTRCPTLEIDNFGKGGAMVNQMRRHFDAHVVASARRYTHLVVFGGVNDLYSDLTAFRTPEKIEADLGYMYAWGRAHETKVIALTVAPWGDFKRYFNASRAEATLRLNAWIRAQPQLGSVDHVVDAYALLSCGSSERLCEPLAAPFKDGLHFGPKGHERLGQALVREAFPECE